MGKDQLGRGSGEEQIEGIPKKGIPAKKNRSVPNAAYLRGEKRCARKPYRNNCTKKEYSIRKNSPPRKYQKLPTSKINPELKEEKQRREV